jgi:hypothetical protein
MNYKYFQLFKATSWHDSLGMKLASILGIGEEKMKALKRVFIGVTVFVTTSFFILGGMNSIIVDENAFLKNDLNIKFAKRLDDLNGEVTIGRMAASLPEWNQKDALAQKKIKSKLKEDKKTIQKQDLVLNQEETVERIEVPVEKTKPAIRDAIGLELTGGLYKQKPINNSKVIAGSLSVVDGVLEEVSFILPDGTSRSLSLVNSRMVGNVFQFEDTETRDIRSGLFYVLNREEGKYMLTITNDTNFGGLRLEYTDPRMVDSLADSYTETQWGMNAQNDSSELKQQAYETTYQEEEDGFYRDEYANNMDTETLEYNQPAENYDEYREESDEYREDDFGPQDDQDYYQEDEYEEEPQVMDQDEETYAFSF